MRIFTLICLALAAVSAVAGQSIATPKPEMPKDPRDMLAAALPQYDFATTTKPWHIKGTYQLYDESGNPAQQGSYEYWRESAKVYRSSWNRTDATRTEWHTIDDKTVYKATGNRLFYFEHKLETLLFSPVPSLAKLNSAEIELKKDQLEIGKIKLPCVEIKARMRSDRTTPLLPGLPTGDYCLDPLLPVLRVEHLFNSVYVEFNKLTKMQNRMLAREIAITDGRHKLLVFEVNMTNELLNEHAVLLPPVDAISFAGEERLSSPSQGLLTKKVPPVYPLAARASHVSGVVILDAMIGKDGRVGSIRVLGTPSPLLTSASKDAVAQWQYAPFIVDGQPQEVSTIINVSFTLAY